jgi:diguanylate cyclase (GGDEF)-like protein
MHALVDGERAVLWLASNISQRHHLEARLRQLSETDELTGLCNRRRFMQILGQQLTDYVPETADIALLIVDIDHFKPINDQYGHLDGDLIIKTLTAVCAAELDTNALFARLGGEEFAIVLTDTTPGAALRIAERLRQAVAASRFELECATVVPVTISIGASVVRPYRRRINELLRDADIALYEAKSQGRNRVVMARDPDPASRRA